MDAAPAAGGFAEGEGDALFGLVDAAGAVEGEFDVFEGGVVRTVRGIGIVVMVRSARTSLLEKTEVTDIGDAGGRQVDFQPFIRHGVGAADLVVLPGPAADVAGFFEGGGGGGEEAEVRDLAAPGEDGFVVGFFHDLFLQAEEGLFAFAVQEGHVDVEDAQEAVGHVFDAAAAAGGGPGHALGDAGGGEGPVVEEAFEADARCGGDVGGEFFLLADEAPVFVVEDHVLRGEEFL